MSDEENVRRITVEILTKWKKEIKELNDLGEDTSRHDRYDGEVIEKLCKLYRVF